jgi:hypothetical protein
VQLSSFRQTLLFIDESRFYFCIEPNFSPIGANRLGTSHAHEIAVTIAAIDLNNLVFSQAAYQTVTMRSFLLMSVKAARRCPA